MKLIKINAKGAGKWADPDTNIPQIRVAEGDEVTVSDELAAMMVPNCAKDITPEPEDADVLALTAEITALITANGGSLDDLTELEGKDKAELEQVLSDLTAAQEADKAAADKAAADKTKKNPAQKDKKTATSR